MPMCTDDQFVGWIALVKWKPFDNPDYDTGEVCCNNQACPNDALYDEAEANFCIQCGAALEPVVSGEGPELSPIEYFESFESETLDAINETFCVVNFDVVHIFNDANQPLAIKRKFDDECTVLAIDTADTRVAVVEDDGSIWVEGGRVTALPTRAPSKKAALQMYMKHFKLFNHLIEHFELVYGTVKQN